MRNVLKIGIGLLLMASIYGCGTSSVKTPSPQQLPAGVVIGTVKQITVGPPINGQKTVSLMTEKGTNDGISVGTIGSIRIHKAALLEYRVEEVSDTSCELQRPFPVSADWYFSNIKKGDRIIFNVGGLSDDELFELSDKLSK